MTSATGKASSSTYEYVPSRYRFERKAESGAMRPV